MDIEYRDVPGGVVKFDGKGAVAKAFAIDVGDPKQLELAREWAMAGWSAGIRATKHLADGTFREATIDIEADGQTVCVHGTAARQNVKESLLKLQETLDDRGSTDEGLGLSNCH